MSFVKIWNELIKVCYKTTLPTKRYYYTFNINHNFYKVIVKYKKVFQTWAL